MLRRGDTITNGINIYQVVRVNKECDLLVLKGKYENSFRTKLSGLKTNNYKREL